MWTPEYRGRPSPKPLGRDVFRRALRALVTAGAFLLWAARRGFFTAWPV
jgi:hypothetical protein